VLGARLDRRVVGQLVRIRAAQHADQRVQPGGEARAEVVHVEAHHREVVGERAGGDAESDPAGEARRQPRRLLGHERGRPQREQQRARRRPARRHRLEAPARLLERVGEVAGEAAVVLAGHDAVEAVVGGERGLGPQLVDDRRRRQVVVGVHPQRDRAAPERLHAQLRVSS
jgi:hypothetical protein